MTSNDPAVVVGVRASKTTAQTEESSPSLEARLSFLDKGLDGLDGVSGAEVRGLGACLVLDGTLSSDPENGPLTYLWFVEPNVVPLSAGAKTTNCLEVGTHTIVLAVTDSDGLTDTETKTVEVVTAPLAIEILIEKVNESLIPRRTKRELVATLRVALTQAGYDHHRQTQVALSAFEKKVRAQVVSGYPALATSWIRWSQAVTEGMGNCIKPPTKPKGGTGKGGDDGNNNEPN